jgi:cytochrome P450 monooxygenase-1
VIALLLGTFIVHQFHSSETAKPPVINKKQRFWGSEAVQQSTFTFQSRRILEEGLKRYPKKAFRILSDTGIVTILPPEVADEIRNDDRFEFRGSNAKVRGGCWDMA